MKLTNNNAISITNILSGMRLNKILDKEIKNALVLNYIALRKVAKDADADTEEIINKFQEDWKDAIAPVRAMRESGKPVAGYEDFLEAEADANGTIATIMDGEVDVDIKTMNIDKFLNAVDDEDISFEQVAFFKDCGLIE